MDFKNKKILLFDLDGTVVDTGPGIKNGVRYTLSKLNVPIQEGDTLDRFIGPPMHMSFPAFYGFSEELSLEAIRIYREYYSEEGLFECDVYPGIKELFVDLKKGGKTICIATSKPERFAKLILDKFSLSEYIDVMGGATMDGTRENKSDIINYVFEMIPGADRGNAVLIGDRHFDIDGAKACSVSSVGVLYGYGDREEFLLAGADAVVGTVDDLRSLLLG